MKKILLMVLVSLLSQPVWADDGKEREISCSIFDAEYVPSTIHPEDKLRFEMHIVKNEEYAPLDRGVFFQINAFEKASEKKVSTLRLASRCSQHSSQCDADAEMGQYKNLEDMEEIKTSLVFSYLAIDRSFKVYPDYLWNNKFTPQAIIFPHDKYHFTRNEAFKDDWDKYTKFYTEEKIFPDFTGKEIWVFSSCTE